MSKQNKDIDCKNDTDEKYEYTCFWVNAGDPPEVTERDSESRTWSLPKQVDKMWMGIGKSYLIWSEKHVELAIKALGRKIFVYMLGETLIRILEWVPWQNFNQCPLSTYHILWLLNVI